jgi:hypothetical protein
LCDTMRAGVGGLPGGLRAVLVRRDAHPRGTNATVRGPAYAVLACNVAGDSGSSLQVLRLRDYWRGSRFPGWVGTVERPVPEKFQFVPDVLVGLGSLKSGPSLEGLRVRHDVPGEYPNCTGRRRSSGSTPGKISDQEVTACSYRSCYMA